jgi:maltose alpha-D-glucosyltransferase/alpha-amylase
MQKSPPEITIPLTPDSILSLFHQADFTGNILPSYLKRQRWFTSKGKQIASCTPIQKISISENTFILVLLIGFEGRSQEVYQLPLAILEDYKVAMDYEKEHAKLILAVDQLGSGRKLLVDAVPLESFRHELFRRIKSMDTTDALLTFEAGKILRNDPEETVSSTLPSVDSSNTAIIYNDRYFFKLFRKLDPGLNPDLELTRFLSESSDFSHSPTYCGSFSIAATPSNDFINLGLMIGKIDNQGDAWGYFQNLTERFYRGILDHKLETSSPPPFQAVTSYGELASASQKVLNQETFDRASLLGRRTGEMHLALNSAKGENADSELRPEPFTDSYREEVYNAAQRLLDRQFSELSYRKNDLPPTVRTMADSVLLLRQLIEERLGTIRKRGGALSVSRIHADYHLGQVLATGDDFCIIDFEGEPLLSIPERRRKRPPFKDVAGMIRSFHYAAMGQLLLNEKYTDTQRNQLSNWGEWWFRQVRSSYLNGYLSITQGSDFVPDSNSDREDLLDFFVLEKAIYETAYELNSRPNWLPIPLRGMLFALQDNEGK